MKLANVDRFARKSRCAAHVGVNREANSIAKALAVSYFRANDYCVLRISISNKIGAVPAANKRCRKIEIHTSTKRRQRFKNTGLPRIVRPDQQMDWRQVQRDVAQRFVVLDAELCDHFSPPSPRSLCARYSCTASHHSSNSGSFASIPRIRATGFPCAVWASFQFRQIAAASRCSMTARSLMFLLNHLQTWTFTHHTPNSATTTVPLAHRFFARA